MTPRMIYIEESLFDDFPNDLQLGVAVDDSPYDLQRGVAV